MKSGVFTLSAAVLTASCMGVGTSADNSDFEDTTKGSESQVEVRSTSVDQEGLDVEAIHFRPVEIDEAQVAKEQEAYDAEMKRAQSKKGPQSTYSQCPRSNGDFAEPGEYAVGVTSAGLGNSVYYPKNMDGKCKHPILAWGNGTGVPLASLYGTFLKHLASHGFVVIASDSPMAGSGTGFKNRLTWLSNENKRQGSIFYQKLSTNTAGTIGHSQGGMGAVAGGSAANVKAVVSVEGPGFFSSKPTLFLTGSFDFLNALIWMMAYPTARSSAFVADYSTADHIATPTVLGAFTPAAKQFRRLSVAWFRCYLVQDNDACHMFENAPNCEFCRERGWAKTGSKGL